MALLGIFNKQPVEVLDYDVDYTPLVSTDGDKIESATVTVDPELPNGGVTWTHTDTHVKVWVAGGIDGGVYKFEVTASTHMGRVKQDEFRIRVREI